MKDNFEACLAHVLQSEGGYVDHPSDPGGATNMGITIATLRTWRGRSVTKADVKALTRAEAAAIYRKNYWDAVRGDDLPRGLDLVAFDAAVNSGVSRGAKWLQSALGVPADGKVGPKTITAANAAHKDAVIDRACDLRLGFLRQLGTWKTFGKGWTRRVEDVRDTASKMAAEHVTVTPVAPPSQSNPFAALIAWLNRIFGV